jgi:hypothetical protein
VTFTDNTDSKSSNAAAAVYSKAKYVGRTGQNLLSSSVFVLIMPAFATNYVVVGTG